MILPKLGSMFAGLVHAAHRLGIFPAFLPATPGPMHRLVVVGRKAKVMRPARIDRRDHRHPPVTVEMKICTHVARGKTWPKKTAVNRLREVA